MSLKAGTLLHMCTANASIRYGWRPVDLMAVHPCHDRVIVLAQVGVKPNWRAALGQCRVAVGAITDESNQDGRVAVLGWVEQGAARVAAACVGCDAWGQWEGTHMFGGSLVAVHNIPTFSWLQYSARHTKAASMG